MAQTLNKKCYWQLIKDPSNMLKVIKYCLCGYMISDTLLKQDSPIIAQPSEPYHIPPPPKNDLRPWRSTSQVLILQVTRICHVTKCNRIEEIIGNKLGFESQHFIFYISSTICIPVYLKIYACIMYNNDNIYSLSIVVYSLF